ncbi:MAG: 30S ribosomal protein S6 [Leptospiraceae bacterium]|jgi:small subunit ribosomal protein S6|nr:30S ribosomal protein S6 [Leptospiraceae bacterium]MCZ8239314.1 30S ribosomal protein S6 [Leptospiraceae bacterium]MCZ8348080.1 30S ribosomal protein S6 [Leptospiraceae bacterium]PJE00119.1 MAG: 30S ribosomal protein S6 [Leptospira sp.]
MRNYEITAVYRTNAVEETRNSFKDILSKNGVAVQSEEDWGNKRLWHHVDGEENGFYHHFKCNAEPSSIAKIENDAKLNLNILKAMVIRQNG